MTDRLGESASAQQTTLVELKKYQAVGSEAVTGLRETQRDLSAHLGRLLDVLERKDQAEGQRKLDALGAARKPAAAKTPSARSTPSGRGPSDDGEVF